MATQLSTSSNLQVPDKAIVKSSPKQLLHMVQYSPSNQLNQSKIHRHTFIVKLGRTSSVSIDLKAHLTAYGVSALEAAAILVPGGNFPSAYSCNTLMAPGNNFTIAPSFVFAPMTPVSSFLNVPSTGVSGKEFNEYISGSHKHMSQSNTMSFG